MTSQKPSPSSPTRTTSRRRFLQSATAGILACGVAPRVLGASDKAGSRLPRVGSGEHTYECHHDWGMDSLPAGHHYGGASHGVAIDSQGLVYVTHHGEPGSIFVFDPHGRFIREMGATHQIPEGRGKGSVGRGHGIDFRIEHGEEFIYLSPNESSLNFAKTTRTGELVWRKGREDLADVTQVFDNPKTVFRPTNISFRPDGGYYLGDGYGSHTIFEFDRKDRFVRTIGGRGKEDGQFQTPHGQWLDDRDGEPKLVVADRANQRLQWFDMDGHHLKTLDGFLFPADIDTRGEVMLVPDLHARVTLLNGKNQVIAQLGDDPAWREKVLDRKLALRTKRNQWQPGKFVHPHDACFDADGNIFVAEWVVTGRVTKLVKVG